MTNEVDILEDDILHEYPQILEILLKDNTTGKNIFWATDTYSELGQGYQFHDTIEIDNITGEQGLVVCPRSVKSTEVQIKRVKDRGEVFTPSWVCNIQNNLIDEVWFGRKDVFNTEIEKSWKNHFPVNFLEDESWRDYVKDKRLEITCGEAPYIVSRYEPTTGEQIFPIDRIGLLDRKFKNL